MSASDDDSELGGLMRSAQSGDAAAYERLLRLLVPRLRRMVAGRRRVLQPADVEDIVQDILVSLHTVRATWDPARPFLPWLSAIAHNRMADAARRHVRRAANETLTDALPETFATDGTKDAEGRLVDADALKHAIDGLPEGQRRALELLKLRELSLRDAAALSGSSVAALKVSVHRAMAALRRAMKDGS